MYYLKEEASEQYSGHMIPESWHRVLTYYHIDKTQSFGANFPTDMDDVEHYIQSVFEADGHISIFDLIQRLINYTEKGKLIANTVNAILSHELSSYRVYDDSIIAPIASDVDRDTILAAITETKNSGASGSLAHIKNAIQLMNESRFADSVRESINAVESIAKVLSNDHKAELGTALAILEKSSNIHGGMKRAFNALYGYTSDEKGIRHSLLYGNEAEVDEADALFMIGACSAFVTYLINRARNAGISVVSTE